MMTLFIDTSGFDVSIAVVDGYKVLSQIARRIPNQHSIYTVSFINEMIEEAGITVDSIEKIMVVTGPGSFTGVRIGVTIAKVYAYIKNIDVIPVSSLKMMALSIEHDYCLSLIDAHHGNYYLGLYDKNNNEVILEQFNKKEYILELIEKYNPILISNEEFNVDGYLVKKCNLNIEKVVAGYQDKEGVNPHLLVPNYLKLPQALEVNK